MFSDAMDKSLDERETAARKTAVKSDEEPSDNQLGERGVTQNYINVVPLKNLGAKSWRDMCMSWHELH